VRAADGDFFRNMCNAWPAVRVRRPGRRKLPGATGTESKRSPTGTRPRVVNAPDANCAGFRQWSGPAKPFVVGIGTWEPSLSPANAMGPILNGVARENPVALRAAGEEELDEFEGWGPTQPVGPRARCACPNARGPRGGAVSPGVSGF